MGTSRKRNPVSPLDMGWVNEVRINTQAVQRDAADIIGRRSLKKEWQAAWLVKALTLSDHTTLSGDDTSSNVGRLCAEAVQPLPAGTLKQLESVGLYIKAGAICVYHNHVETAVEALRETGIPVAAVSTGFPHAENPFEVRVAEIEASVAAGATEIDVVITREHVLTGNWQKLYNEIVAYREACGEAHMKVIFETGELSEMENVAKASRVAMMAGADFIKTSTGKAVLNANPAVSLVMMRQIREYHERTGYQVGLKPAGGISEAKTALEYLTLVKETLGDEWLNPDLFRFGASSLQKDIKRQLYHFATGRYADSDYTEQRVIKFTDAQLEKIAAVFGSMEYGPAPESDAKVIAWLKEHEQRFGHYIGGEFVEGEGEEFETGSPADKSHLATFRNATQEEVDEAVEAAQRAHAQWTMRSGFERAKFLYALARKVHKNAKLFAVLESKDNGKPFRESFKIDIPLVIRHLNYHADLAQIAKHKLPEHEPYGVAGQIIPWNFPLLMLAWKIAPALAAGNSVVLKPAEQTPLTAMLFAELCDEAAIESGAPSGLVNIVNGDKRVGEMIVNHEGIDKIAFTGSTEVGRIIRKATAGSGKGLTLELGGKSPFIVFADADLDAAVEGVVNSIWFNQGEVCCGQGRIFAQESVRERFIEKLKARMQTLRVGDPLDKSVDMSAVVSMDQVARIGSMVADAVKSGAEIYQPAYDACNEAKGCYYPPTLVTNVDPTDAIMQEEVFGPVVCVASFRTHEEAVKLANQTPMGLAASIWSENAGRTNQVAAQLHCGVVWINCTNQFDAVSGFGGYKESGFGREGGIEGLRAYMKPREPITRDLADTDAPETKFKSIAPQLIDLTPKLFIGGQQVRPDEGYTRAVVDPYGVKVGEIGLGNRKDIRNAVAAAEKAASWGSATAYNRSQILRFIAENLSQRADEFAARVKSLTAISAREAMEEVTLSLEALFNAAAWCNNYEGAVHQPPSKMIVPALNEPVGIIGISCPNERPLLSMVTMIGAAIAMGNRVVVTPSEKCPLLTTDFYQVLNTSDVPAGVVNIVTGNRDELADTLSKHEAVDAVWYHGSKEGSAMVEINAANSNLKQSWTNAGKPVNWERYAKRMQDFLLPRATKVKNIWIPYGEGVGMK